MSYVVIIDATENTCCVTRFLATLSIPHNHLCCRLTEYDNKTSFFGGGAPLSQAVGYPLVIGVAAAFVLLTVGLFWLDRHYAGTE